MTIYIWKLLPCCTGLLNADDEESLGVMNIKKGSLRGVERSPGNHPKICSGSCRNNEKCMEAMSNGSMTADLRSKQQAMGGKERGESMDRAIEDGVIFQSGKQLIGNFRVANQYFVCARAWAYIYDWKYSTLKRKLRNFERVLLKGCNNNNDMLKKADNGVSSTV
jgi:hypothetical protein